MKHRSLKVIIVGGGLSGLSAAHTLENLGHLPFLLESSERIGGRVRTDKEEGYLLDVGFQVALDSYPELKPCLKYLDLGKFGKGAHYRSDKGWKLLDARSFLKWNREEWRGLLALGKRYFSLNKADPGETTASLIHSLKVPNFEESFLNPFFRGIFLEKKLETPAKRFLDLLSYFALGRACLPAKGMEAIPIWFAKQLKKTEIKLNAEVVEVGQEEVSLSTGEQIKGDAVLLALSRAQLARLIPSIGTIRSCSVSCDYFTIRRDALKASCFLWLDGRVQSPINNFCFLNAVQPAYAPAGVHLVSATSLSNPFPSVEEVREYLCAELGITGRLLIPLGRKIVGHALPSQVGDPYLKTRYLQGCFITGEAVDPPSINDAIASGRKSALALHHGVSSL